MALDYMDLEGQLSDVITVDEYAAKIGKDSDIVTLTFTVNSKLAAQDLVTWFERGYDFVLDASVSDGEIETGKWLVFVEMNRRSKSDEQIMEMISDLETLTGFQDSDWEMKIADKVEPASAKFIRNNLDLSPHSYRASHDEPLNEWRQIAGIPTIKTYGEEDEAIKAIKRQAGIF